MRSALSLLAKVPPIGQVPHRISLKLRFNRFLVRSYGYAPIRSRAGRPGKNSCINFINSATMCSIDERIVRRRAATRSTPSPSVLCDVAWLFHQVPFIGYWCPHNRSIGTCFVHAATLSIHGFVIVSVAERHRLSRTTRRIISLGYSSTSITCTRCFALSDYSVDAAIFILSYNSIAAHTTSSFRMPVIHCISVKEQFQSQLKQGRALVTTLILSYLG